MLRKSPMLTWEQGEGHWVDAVLLGGAGALGVGDVHLELHRLLENRRTGRGLVLRPETGLGDDAVAKTRDLKETGSVSRWMIQVDEQILLQHPLAHKQSSFHLSVLFRATDRAVAVVCGQWGRNYSLRERRGRCQPWWSWVVCLWSRWRSALLSPGWWSFQTTTS